MENVLVIVSRAGEAGEELLERVGRVEGASKGVEGCEFVYLNCRGILMDNENY
jgi:hypothetical protein